MLNKLKKLRRSPKLRSKKARETARDRLDLLSDDAYCNSSISSTCIAFLWLFHEASSFPRDLLGLVMSFAGPQVLSKLSRVCKAWRSILLTDAIWRVMCEELGKWHTGEAIPKCWLRHYKNSPIVPIDYSTIEHAYRHFDSIESMDDPVRILLRSGNYSLQDTLRIDDGTEIIIESVSSHRKRMSSVSSKLCSKRLRIENYDQQHSSYLKDGATDDVTITLHTLKPNQPLIRVQRGKVILRGLNFSHDSSGVDIWNGNSVIQVQPSTVPSLTENYRRQNLDNLTDLVSNRYLVSHAKVVVDNCSLTSFSGRGVVAIDGGFARIKHSYIHNCAATGIYIGNPHLTGGAHISNCDILSNGFGSRSEMSNGNFRNRGVISRGHSGIYLEQGALKMSSCNVSKNSLTGLSCVSEINCQLQCEDSHVLFNGNGAIDLPGFHSLSYRNCSLSNVQTSVPDSWNDRDDIERDSSFLIGGTIKSDVLRRRLGLRIITADGKVEGSKESRKERLPQSPI